jgi:hypothetical protein
VGLKHQPLQADACPPNSHQAAARLLSGQLSIEDTPTFVAHCAHCVICRAALDLERGFLRSVRTSMLSTAGRWLRQTWNHGRGLRPEPDPE